MVKTAVLFCAIAAPHLLAAYLTFTTDYPAAYDIAGFDWLSRLEVFKVFDGEGKEHRFRHGGKQYRVQWVAAPLEIRVWEDKKQVAAVALRPWLEKLRVQKESKKALTQETCNQWGCLKIFIEDISARWNGAEPPVLYHLKADILYRSSQRVR